MKLSEICHSIQISAATAFISTVLSRLRLALYTSLYTMDRFPLYNCTKFSAFYVRLKIVLSTLLSCVHPHVTNTRSRQLNPENGDYSIVFNSIIHELWPCFLFLNLDSCIIPLFLFWQMNSKCTEKFRSFSQENVEFYEQFMRVYVLTFEPPSIWISCSLDSNIARPAEWAVQFCYIESDRCTVCTVLNTFCRAKLQWSEDTSWSLDWWLMTDGCHDCHDDDDSMMMNITQKLYLSPYYQQNILLLM